MAMVRALALFVVELDASTDGALVLLQMNMSSDFKMAAPAYEVHSGAYEVHSGVCRGEDRKIIYGRCKCKDFQYSQDACWDKMVNWGGVAASWKDTTGQCNMIKIFSQTAPDDCPTACESSQGTNYAPEKVTENIIGDDTQWWQSKWHCSLAPKKAHPWSLAANINPCDGHNMGYGGPWASGTSVGTPDTCLSEDYVNSDVMKKTAGYVAIARHSNGLCEMTKTWKLSDQTKSLFDYFSTLSGRLCVTGDCGPTDQHIHQDVSDTATGLGQDPIFGADGGLAFNWWYSNNGVRIVVPGSHKVPYVLPGTGENTDDLHGLGNEFGASTQQGQGSTSWWHDVGQLQGDCHGTDCKVVGTDHGTRLSDGDCWGGVQWAIYISETASKFQCQGRSMSKEMSV